MAVTVTTDLVVRHAHNAIANTVAIGGVKTRVSRETLCYNPKMELNKNYGSTNIHK